MAKLTKKQMKNLIESIDKKAFKLYQAGRVQYPNRPAYFTKGLKISETAFAMLKEFDKLK